MFLCPSPHLISYSVITPVSPPSVEKRLEKTCGVIINCGQDFKFPPSLKLSYGDTWGSALPPGIKNEISVKCVYFPLMLCIVCI